MKEYLSHLNHRAAYPLIALIYVYQWTLSPDRSPLLGPLLRGRICSHQPHCSAYGIQVLRHYGLFPGIIYMVDRITSCTPSPYPHHDPAILRVVFASSAPIGVPFLEKISADPRYDLVGVVTNPDQPVGRGMKVRENVIKSKAKKYLKKNPRVTLDFYEQDNRDRIISGSKTVETRAGDPTRPERNNIQKGDIICLRYPAQNKSILVQITKTYYRKNIDQLFTEDQSLIRKINPKFTTIQTTKNIYQSYHKDYKDRLEQHGLLGREFEIVEDNEFISTPRSLRLESKKYADDASAFQSRLTAKKPDILVVIAYGKIIPQHILDIPAIAPINVHGSLLPAYRGASPIQSVLLHDEPETGITIMGMDAGLDTGPILATSSFTLTIHTTALDIIHTFQKIGPDLLVDTIRDYAKGHLHAQTQDDSLATHTTKLSKSDGLIDPSTQSLYQINNIYRGCYLWPKAHFVRTHDDKQITVTIDSLTLNESLRDQHKDEPIWNNQHQLNPAIISLSVKPANSKTMSRKAFLAGY